MPKRTHCDVGPVSHQVSLANDQDVQEAPVEPNALHPLLWQRPVETNHEIGSDAEATLVADEELAPGLNCCAVCATSAENESDGLFMCPRCNRVGYCAKEHAAKDAACHNRNCTLLSYVDVAERVHLDVEQQRKCLRLLRLQPSELVCLHGWSDVVTDACSAVWNVQLSAHRTSNKRRRVSHGSGISSPSARGLASPTGSPPHIVSSATAAAAAIAAAAPPPHLLPVPPPDMDDEFHLAVQLAVATMFASYPLSALYGLRTCTALYDATAETQMMLGSSATPTTSSSGSGAQGAGGLLVLCVLGASETAELAHLDMWKVLEGLGGWQRVLLQFVGPEVPAELHNTVKRLSSQLTATFWQGKYDRLLDAAAMAEAGRALARHNAPSPASGSGVAAADLLPSELLCLPDAFVGYNMGLTCPDYEWQPTLDAIHRVLKRKVAAACLALGRGTTARVATAPLNVTSPPELAAGGIVRLPLLTTSNTLAESLHEDELLCESGWHVAQAVQHNPLGSLETLQSGTLGNDLYRKNAWLACYELRAVVQERRKIVLPKKKGLAQRVRGWIHSAANKLPKLLGHKPGSGKQGRKG